MMSNALPYRPYDYRFWAAFWVHMRPYLLFVSGAAGLSGLALSPGFTLLSWRAGLGLLAFFFAYGFGQALTDCFQTDTDRLAAPYRPLSQGLVTSRDVGMVALGGLIGVSALLIVLNYWNIVLCGLSIIGLVTYTYFKRHHWWAGPFYNAWIVALLPIMGYLIGTQHDFDALSDDGLGTLVLLTFFSYANFVLIGYLKDIGPDRQTGYRTFPVVFGWRATAVVGVLFGGVSTYLALQLVAASSAGLLLALAGSGVAASGLLYALATRDHSEPNAAFPIATTVRSFILWHLAVAVAYHSALWWWAVGYYALFEIVLRSRPMREQI